jgi:hypothetical protein
MSEAGRHFPLLAAALRLWATVALSSLLAGCAGLSPRKLTLGPGYQPANVFTWSTTLPAGLKRVAILPVASMDANDLPAGREALEPILQAELFKLGTFEVVFPNPESLRAHTGRVSWNSEDELPPAFFSSLRESTGCDAVLFCRLTTFHAYAPLVVGWRMRLVEVNRQVTLWATDEVFDAGKSSVRNGARRYQLDEIACARTAPDDWSILNSPRQFGQYATASLLATLPHR